MRALIYFFILLVNTPAIIAAPKPLSQYARQTLLDTSRLPQGTVEALYQDKQGYIWAGTQEGAVRFDGLNTLVFNSHRFPQLRGDGVLAITACGQDSIWLGTRGGLARIHDEDLTVIELPDSIRAPVSSLACRDGALWLGTAAGLAVVEGEDVRLFENPVLGMAMINTMHLDDSGTLWAASETAVFAIHDNVKIVISAKDIGEHRIKRIFRDKQNRLWVGTNEALYRHDANGLVNLNTMYGMDTISVNAFTEDAAGTLYLGTENHGLLRIASNDAVDQFNRNNGASDDTVRSLLIDRDQAIWMGTFFSGATRLHDAEFASWNTDEGMSSGMTRSIHGRAANRVWVATHGGGVNEIRDGRVFTYTRKNGLSSDSIWTVAEDAQGQTWVGTYGSGLDKISNGIIEHIDEASGFTGKFVSSIVPAKDGSLWIVARPGGLFRSTDDGKTFHRIRTIGVENSGGIFEDIYGHIWVFFWEPDSLLLHFKDGKLYRSFTPKQGLPHASVLGITQDNHGHYWLATYDDGLYRFDGIEFQRISTQEGLFDNTAFQVVSDKLGYLWTNSNHGIFRVSADELDAVLDGKLDRVHSQRFGTVHGMKSSETNGGASPSVYLSDDGSLWFPTINGVTRVFPSELKQHANIALPVRIEAIAFNGKNQGIHGELAAPPGTSQITVAYTAIDYLTPADIRFRYHISGLGNDEWQDAGTRRELLLAHLPPGEYRLEISAARPGGEWSALSAALAFTLKPSLMETVWFRFLLAAAIILLLFAGFLLRMSVMRRRQTALKALVRQKTQKLRESYLEVKKLAERDHLTGLANRRAFDRTLRKEIRRAQRSGVPLTLMIVDVDHFKHFNDIYGHIEGDRCLQRIAAILNEFCRKNGDLAARYGGEEFALILPGTPHKEAEVIAHSMCARVRSLAIPHAGNSAQRIVTVSLGAATAPLVDVAGTFDLLKSADHALYTAKRRGRNRAEQIIHETYRRWTSTTH